MTISRRALALVFAVSSALVAGTLHHPPPAHASGYACATNHCYGIVDWPGATTGESTQIYVASLSPGDGFVTNETWFNGDPGPGSACPLDGNPVAGCWVEAGVTVGQVDKTYCATDCYYWADERPCSNGCQSNYNEHFLGYPPAGDIGQRTTFQIVVDPPCGPCGWTGDCPGNEFGVTVTGASGAVFSGLSYANGMIPSSIDVGMELYGTNGASASGSVYTYNQYRDNAGVYHYQANDGQIFPVNAPVQARWEYPPSSNQVPGGAWSTSCPAGGC